MTVENNSLEVTELVFKSELTAQGLADLRAKYPVNLVVDMSDDEAFKAARKTRTECNKLVAAIDDRRKDVNTMLKDHGDNLIAKVKEIYSVVIDPFEEEDARRKKIAAEEKAKLEKLLAEQRLMIQGFRENIKEAEISDQEAISGMIDALSNIDLEYFHKDVVHEAMTTVKEVSEQLSSILVRKIESDRISAALAEAEAKAEIERAAAAEAAEKAAAAAAEAQRLADEKFAEEKKRTEINERLSTLRMIPIDLMGEHSSTIGKKINSLEKYVIPADEFGERYAEACNAKDGVIKQLKSMLESTLKVEAYELDQESARLSALAQQNLAAEVSQDPAIQYEQVQHQTEQRETLSPAEVLASMGRASDLLQDNQQEHVQTQEHQIPATLKGCIDAWYFEHSITPEAYSDLMGILANYQVKLN